MNLDTVYCWCVIKGFQKRIKGIGVPGWGPECEDLDSEFTDTANRDTSGLLLNSLENASIEKWVNSVQNQNFIHSHRKTWSFTK